MSVKERLRELERCDMTATQLAAWCGVTSARRAICIARKLKGWHIYLVREKPTPLYRVQKGW